MTISPWLYRISPWLNHHIAMTISPYRHISTTISPRLYRHIYIAMTISQHRHDYIAKSPWLYRHISMTISPWLYRHWYGGGWNLGDDPDSRHRWLCWKRGEGLWLSLSLWSKWKKRACHSHFSVVEINRKCWPLSVWLECKDTCTTHHGYRSKGEAFSRHFWHLEPIDSEAVHGGRLFMDSGDDLMSFESRTGDQDKTYLWFFINKAKSWRDMLNWVV